MARLGGINTNSDVYVTTGAFVVPYATTAISIGLDASHCVVTVSATATITLPTAVGILGRIYRIKNIGAAATVTIATTSSQTIDGITTQTLTVQYDSITIISDGANWHII